MSEDNYIDINDIIKYPESLPENAEGKAAKDEIRILNNYRKGNRKPVANGFFRFAVTVAAFIGLFSVVYLLSKTIEYQRDGNNFYDDSDPPVSGDSLQESYEDTDVSVKEEKEPPRIIDEAKTGINMSDYYDDTMSLSHLLNNENKISVLLVHSHASEYVSESISVTDAGEAMAQLLNSAGIGTLHCKTEHDSEGFIGAYSKMRESVLSLRNVNSGIVLVIDVHDSDTSYPLTFTVGTGADFGWKENLRLSAAIYKNMSSDVGIIRLLPSDLAQNNGALTVHVGIGNKSADDEEARRIISAFVDSIIELSTENTPD